ncbi:helix-turn-helix transcriptional regulator [Pseudovibrio flavus]|uniref:helix-turn-helix transcriptional regulator n=1 Tax=Pseudovibrio flavus TaxID=2529854 RepID=UPI0035275752
MSENTLRDLDIVAELREDDDDRLANYFRIAQSMADLIGPHCEVVVHSLQNYETSVAKIVNGHLTGRKIGSPITDLGLRMLREYRETGNLTPKPYFTRNAAGQLLKSTTTIILGQSGKPIGMFCVNINLSMPFSEIVGAYTPGFEETGTAALDENFSHNATETINSALDLAISEVDADPTIGPKAHNKTITKLLYERGIFEFKEATALAAERLGISRHAIYKYIREFKPHQD